jgi:predicted Fe-Mo cluster-binding NifX family protein
MRIAIPIMENKGKDSEIAEHFGHVREMAVYDSDKDKIEIVDVINTSGCSPVESIKDKNVDAIYCQGMGMRAMALCQQMNIKLKTGPYQTIKEIIENIDKLEDLEESCGH